MTTANPAPLEDQYSIVAKSERRPAPSRVLKDGDTFMVFDQRGDLTVANASDHGLYHAGTRFLSRLELLLANHHPLLLSSTITDDNALFTADLTNPDLLRQHEVVIPHGSVHVFRSRVLWAGSCIERLRVASYMRHPVTVALTVRFEADFADVFEVRGMSRARRGERLGAETSRREQVFRYRGLDGLERRTRVRVDREPVAVENGVFTFVLALEPTAPSEIEVHVACEQESDTRSVEAHSTATLLVRKTMVERATEGCRVSSSNDALNRWLRRSSADLNMMQTETRWGMYPYAGIPWFSTPFGRDGLITALQTSWANPLIARGVLSFLAATQATSVSDELDAQPGKILHEMRDGEMARLGEVPFGRYYGSVDATPLFVLLASAYYDRTGDLGFVSQLWPNILGALEWMCRHGDGDGDGFIEYARKSATGLVNQGWKDSADALFHADGTLAEPPIALCEVQAYAYGAWVGAARLAALRGEEALAAEWQERAARLRAAFEEAFWCERIGTYALALDGGKQPCCVRTSNAGHCLFTGIASPQHGVQVCRSLMDDASFGGWGVRTVASGESRYNPMSYHNGSIWPHDNALIAAGMARYSDMEDVGRITGAMLELSQAVDQRRLPELICGFHRRANDGPTLYPVACAPQAWAAGAVSMLLQSCLGLRIDAPELRITLTRPILPAAVEWLELSNVQVGPASLDLRFQRHVGDVGVTVLRRHGEIEVVAVK